MRARGRLTLLAYLSWCSAQQQYAHPFQNVTELEQFFDANTGPGLWKWRHYFTIYDKHLSRFRGTDAKLIEIGIFSGGGLLMWRHYLGPKATIAGLDISPLVKTYDKNPAYGKPDRIFVGSQGDPKLWADIHEDLTFDAIIDDGAHTADMQIATLDLAFKHLNPGGVYIVEDLVKVVYSDKFVKYVFEKYVSGASGINGCILDGSKSRPTPREKASGMDMKCPLISYEQKHVAEVAFYHNVVVITKLPRHGQYIDGRHHTPERGAEAGTGRGAGLAGTASGEAKWDKFLSSFKRGSTWQPPKFWAGQQWG